MLTCPTCRYFRRLNELGGLCRRYAPRALVLTRFRPEFGGNVPAWPNETATIWAPVNDKDYCGDHPPVPEAPLARATVYTVTVLHGVPLTDSDQVLAVDSTFAFETVPKPVVGATATPTPARCCA